MKTNTAKQKMLQGEPAFGYSAKLGSPVAAELLGQCGVDFVLLDGQRGCWGPFLRTRIDDPVAKTINIAFEMCDTVARNAT